MKIFTFLIGSTDDFETIEDLIDYVEVKGLEGSRNYSCFEFDVPEDCSDELVTMIGRGYAFSNDWCMDGTLSFMVHGTLEGAGNGK